jgi:hypothetical protein
MFSKFRKFLIILFFIFSFLPTQSFGATNAGFVPENIWYSIDPFAEGDKIKIYTLVFNPDSRELSGTVIFLDDAVLLGKKDFTVAPKAVKDISIDWTVSAGKHNIYAKIENAKFLISKGKYEDVYLEENETNKSSRSIAKKIIPQNKTEENNISAIDKISTDGSNQIKNIEKIIQENTPSSVANIIDNTENSIDSFRSNLGDASKQKKSSIQDQIKSLNTEDESNGNKLLKPFKYVELFIFSLFSFIMNNKIIFYIALAFIIFYILRFIWRLLF